MQEAATPVEEIEASFGALRKAVEERNYPALERALQEQRRLLSSLTPSDPQIRTIALRGSALIAWAMTMVKIQHAGYAHELAIILNTRQLQLQYASEMARCPELVCLNG